MVSAFTDIAPLTPTLSPEGRGGAGGGVGEDAYAAAQAEPLASPLRGEAAAQRRVRGRKAQPAQVKRARALRWEMTDAENRLWYHLRDRRLGGYKFVRQYPIAGYYADFVRREAMLVLEADGGQHGSERDAVRDAAMKAAGYTLMRFWNNDILNDTDGVLQIVRDTLASCVPSPLRGEGQGEGSASTHGNRE